MSEPGIEQLLSQIVETQKYRLAAECTAKYQHIVMALPADILLQRKKLDEKEWNSASPTIATLHAYIDLCAEELRLWKAGQIPEQVWRNWEEGICAGFQILAVAQLWNNHFTRGPYEELREYLKTKGLPNSTSPH